MQEIENDITYGTLINKIDFHTITITYYYCITASLVSLGFKYAGTNNKEVSNLMLYFLLIIKNIKLATELMIKNQIKFNNNNKFNINKTDQDKILCLISFSLGLVMAGSGDLEILKVFRVLRKRFENDSKNYGYSQAIHQAIGFLFLGAGGLTFSRTLQSLAFLYITIYPIFPCQPNDNDKYLQAMKHFYVLSCESRVLETRDIENNNFVRVPIKICYNDGSILEVVTPFNVIM
jgi:anaphase-promoting complex subunit 1